MQSQTETSNSLATLLTIRAGGSAWAVPSTTVVGVEPFDETSETTPIDVLALLGAPPAPANQAARVLVVRALGDELRLLARGALTLAEIQPRNLLPLPPAFQRTTPLVSHIALVDGKAVLFVISPERLVQAMRAPSSSHHDSVRGSSC